MFLNYGMYFVYFCWIRIIFFFVILLIPFYDFMMPYSHSGIWLMTMMMILWCGEYCIFKKLQISLLGSTLLEGGPLFSFGAMSMLSLLDDFIVHIFLSYTSCICMLHKHCIFVLLVPFITEFHLVQYLIQCLFFWS